MKNKNLFKTIWQQKSLGIFILVAFLLWYSYKMSYDYTVNLEIPVRITSDPESGKWIENPDFTVKAHCQTNGSIIMAYRSGAVSRLSIPVSYLSIKKIDNYSYEIDNNTLSHYIQTQEKELNIISIEDVSRRIRISKASKKNVPIRYDIEASYATEHMNTAGKVILEFDSVTIEAPQIILDTIKEIRTEKIVHEKLSSTVEAKAKLLLPANVFCNKEKVPYKIPVDRFTQFKFKTKVKTSAPTIIGYHSGGSGIHWSNYSGKLTVIPDEVIVFVNLPMSAKTKEKDITAYIDFNKNKESSKYEVHLSGIPKGSAIVAIEPRMVDVFRDIE